LIELVSCNGGLLLFFVVHYRSIQIYIYLMLFILTTNCFYVSK